MLFLLVGVLSLSLSFLYNYLMSRHATIYASWEAERLDLFLKNKYRIELIKFAYVLAEAFSGEPTRTSIKNELNYIDKLHDDLLSGLILYCEKFSVIEGYEVLASKEEKRDYIIKEFGLNLFFELLEYWAGGLRSILNELPAGTKGQSICTRTQVILVWASLMERKGEINWSNIAILFKWFYDRLCDTEYGKDILTTNALKKERAWLRNAYNSNLKILRKSRKSEQAKLKRFENFKRIVVFRRLFYPHSFPKGKSWNIHCINFNENSITVKEKINNNLRRWEVRFIDGKRYPHVSNLTNNLSLGDPPSITFPKSKTYPEGNTYIQSC